jgi:hypothetical protein
MNQKPLKWSSDVKCEICLWDDKDEVLYGDWLSEEGVNVHYFCLLSSNTKQKGENFKIKSQFHQLNYYELF